MKLMMLGLSAPYPYPLGAIYFFLNIPSLYSPRRFRVTNCGIETASVLVTILFLSAPRAILRDQYFISR